MKVIIISILLMLSTFANAVSYKYLYATRDKAKNAELVSDKWANVEFDQENEIIILSFENKFAYFNVLNLERKTDEEITFKVLAGSKEITTFTFLEDCIIFFYGGYKFILTNIPKKYWEASLVVKSSGSVKYYYVSK